MRHLPLFDKLQLLVLVPLWALSLALATRTVLRDVAVPPLFVAGATSTDGYPNVTGLIPWLSPEGEGPAVGDRILRVGASDLRGADRVDFRVAVAREVEPERRVQVSYERAGERREASLRVGSSRRVWPHLFVSLAWALVAVVVLLRVRKQPMARVAFQGFLCGAFQYANGIAGSRVEEQLGMLATIVSVTLNTPTHVRVVLYFPHNEPPQSVWLRLLPWCFAPMGILHFSRTYGFPLPPELGAPGVGVLFMLYAACIAWIGTRSYRRADAVGRRQMKWLLYAVYLNILIYSVGAVLAAFDPVYEPLFAVTEASSILTPLGFLVSVVRFNFLDIDRLLGATASYNLVVIALVAFGLSVVPAAAEAGAAQLGVDPGTGRTALSLLLAGLVVPAQRRLRPWIDRLFFAERHALQDQSARLLQDLSESRTPEELLRSLGERIDALVRPESCAIYARAGGAFSPVYARGRAVPPAFAASGGLAAALAARPEPLAIGRGAPGRRAGDLGRADRAALETLGASLVVPTQLAGNVVGFLCLGPKRSGDIYTSTDVALLSALAQRVSGELSRFEQSDVLRESRSMQEALRRYVPGAVADQLASGGGLEPGEREVSVLFVDIRGYTTFSESRAAAEIFSTVNRYTQTVSEIARKHGGSVVEFNGDGMMVVFGAPLPLPDKERAAVQAGREIVEAIARIAPSGDPATGRLSVGVGIATGEAFVGSIQAVDRSIWSAIGNVVNLAARLQSLTRDWAAAIAIDAPTHARAGEATRGFVAHPETAIRGRSEPVVVHALPLAVVA